MAYNGNSSKIVSSSFLYSTLQTFFTKVKGLLDNKADKTALTTYIKDLSVSGKTITYTKGDNTTGTITTQDTNTTYSAATSSANGLMSSTDKAKLDAITDSADSVSITQKLTSGTEIGTVTINGTGTKLYAPTNTDTHYTSKNVVGSSTATSNTTTALTNGNVYINSVENGAVTSTHKISGSGATTVTTDTSGNIIINSTDTNTTYTHPTTSGNKHIPSGGASGQFLKWSADGTAVWASDNNTTYSAGTGISLSGTTFSNSGVRSISSGSTNGTISVNTNGASAEVAVKGLGSAAYTASTAYATSGHTHNYAGSSSSGGAATTALTCTGNSATATVADKAKNANSAIFVIPSNGTSNAEGGELQLTNQDGTVWHIDSCANNLRIFDSAGNVHFNCIKGTTSSSYFYGTSANADTVDGYHSWQMGGWADNRSVNTTPNDYNSKLEIKGLKSNSSINSPDSSGYSTVLGIRAWYDHTGGQSHEFALTGNGQICQRHGDSTSWSSWNRLYTTENITYGTSALTPGSSYLATGNIYLQYE